MFTLGMFCLLASRSWDSLIIRCSPNSGLGMFFLVCSGFARVVYTSLVAFVLQKSLLHCLVCVGISRLSFVASTFRLYNVSLWLFQSTMSESSDVPVMELVRNGSEAKHNTALRGSTFKFHQEHRNRSMLTFKVAIQSFMSG